MGEYRSIEHTADEGIAWEADDLPGLFAAGAQAFAHFVSGARPGPAPTASAAVDLAGLDLEDLLVRFLQELLYLFETRGEVYPACRVDLLEAGGEGRKARIRAALSGRRFDPDRDEGRAVVKAVTYHALAVEKRPQGGWRARVLFDL